MIVPSLYFFDSLVGENAGIWLKGYCMRWNGGAWEPIPMSADGNFETNPYVAALMDLTEGAPTGTFMSILVRDLIAKTAMIERIFSHKIRIQKIGNDEGAIYGGGFDQNGNPTSGPGFYLGTNGKLKAVDGEFSGTLEARYIRTTGAVSSGTQYLLKTANWLSALYAETSWISATYPAVLKEIRTIAKGSCLIRLYFPIVASSSVNNMNNGSYKIVVNDNIIVNWTDYALNTNIDIPNVPLPNNTNIIQLYGKPATPGNGMKINFYNTIFELRCNQDPGLLASM